MFAKIITAGLFLICATAFGQNYAAAQNKPSNALYAVPSQLLFPGDEKEAEEFEKGILLHEHFYPIGWSKDGKFAYYVEPADEACGCYFSQLVIQDLRTDKILWERSYSDEKKAEGVPLDTLENYWRKNRREFSRKLAQYGIVPTAKFDLRASPINFRNDTLTFNLTENIEFEDIFSIGGFRLQLISKEKGAKTIYKEEFEAKDYSNFQTAEIGGALISPFESRAAAVVIETHRGWEGPPNVTQIRIVGAWLIDGFR